MRTGVINHVTNTVTSQIWNKNNYTIQINCYNYMYVIITNWSFPSLPFSLREKIQLIFFRVIGVLMYKNSIFGYYVALVRGQ